MTKYTREERGDEHTAWATPEIESAPVTVIDTAGQSALVQWKDGDKIKRVFIPTTELHDRKVSADILSIGVPYGSQWEKYIESVTVNPVIVANALRDAGYWTTRDIEVNPHGAQGVINKAVGIMASQVCRLARNAEKDEVKA